MRVSICNFVHHILTNGLARVLCTRDK